MIDPHIPQPLEPTMPGLSTVTVRQSELLTQLRENRAKHQEIFQQAMEGYREEAIKELEAMLQEARNGEPIRRVIKLPEPTDHTKEYDQVIQMVDMSVQDSVELTYQEFAQYVRDDWGWKEQFMTTSTSYIK